MKRKYPMKVLVIERGAEEADALITDLHRTDYTVRAALVQSPGQLVQSLHDEDWDLALVANTVNQLPAARAIELISASGCDLPVIALSDDKRDVDRRFPHALRSLVQDVVYRGEPELITLAVRRELKGLRDRRALRKSKAALREAERALREMLDTSSDACAFIRDGVVVYVNRAFQVLFGFGDYGNFRGLPLSDCVADGDREEFAALLRGAAENDAPVVELDAKGFHPMEGEFPVHFEIGHAVIEGRSVQRVSARPRAPRVAPLPCTSGAPSQDSVTGLPDRDSLTARIGEVQRGTDSSQTGASLIYVQIEGYQDLRRLAGFAGMDTLVCEVASTLMDVLPADVYLARAAEDGFAVLLRNRRTDEVRCLADDCRAALNEELIAGGSKLVVVECTVGVAGLSHEESGPMALLENAHRDSGGGRDGRDSETSADTGDAQETAAVLDPRDFASDFDDAVRDRRLWLVFQPIVRLRDEPLELYEAFMRYRDVHGRLVQPLDFLGAAEDAGLSMKLDLWAVGRVAEILAERCRGGMETRLFVKLSHKAMDDVDVPLSIGRALKERGVPPGRLIVELSETAVVTRMKAARAFVTSLRRIGCKTAIEHFGVSANSFKLLEEIPVDYLKVDSTLVHGLTTDPQVLRTVTKIAEKAKGLGKETIAACLEEARGLALLHQAGLDFAQGYYIQEPKEVLDFEFSIVVE